MTHFKAEFFKQNRQTLLKLFSGTAPIVLTSNGLMQKSTDTHYPFSQDGNFWYLTGITEPNILLVLDKGKEYLIVPKLSEIKEKFDGSIDIHGLRKTSGVEDIFFADEGWRKLKPRIKRSSSVAVIAPSKLFIDSMGMYTNPAKRALTNTIKRYNPNIELLDLRAHFQKMRTVKQPEEISTIKQAISSTILSLRKVRAKYLNDAYKTEFEIEQDLSKYFFETGTEGHSFEPIIASGDKACTIHPVSNINPIKKTEALLLDVGASYKNYCADISRTWHRQPSKRFKQVHQAVKEVSEHAQSLIKPGIILPEYEKAVEQYMGEKLRELGLIKTIDSVNVRKYFPHATSHFLGIDVHDIGDYENPLKVNSVLTVEPGIYIPKEGIGVRIEDDVLVTENGNTNLSASLSSKP
jgi:Xaa-Pro aminopeptidase